VHLLTIVLPPLPLLLRHQRFFHTKGTLTAKYQVTKASSLHAVPLKSILKNREGTERGVAAALQRVQPAQRTAGHLPREATLGDVAPGHRVLVHHLVHRAGLVEEIQLLPWALFKLLGLVQFLQNPVVLRTAVRNFNVKVFYSTGGVESLLTRLYSW